MKVVDFYFSIGSRYSYLASSRIEALQGRFGCRFEWIPVNNPRLMTERGRNPFEAAQAPSGQYDPAYRDRDVKRWARHYGIPFVEPAGRVDFDSELLARACTAAKRLGRVEAVARGLFALLFGGEVDRIGVAECRAVAAAGALDPEAFEQTLHAPETARQLDATIRAAIDEGVFGVPTFRVEGDLFWGNDRLVLLEDHLRRGGGESADP